MGEGSQSLNVLIQAPVMAHAIDSDGRLVDVSSEWLRVLGYSREDVLGRKPIDFLSPASAAFARETALPEFYANGECRQVPYEFVTKGGGLLPVLLSAIALKDAEGTHRRSLAVLTDVSQERLRTAQLKLTFDATGMQVWNWERVDGSWAWTATSELALPGLERGATLKDYAQLVSAEDREQVVTELERAVSGGEGRFSLTHRLASADDPRWLEIVAQVLVDSNGVPVRLIGAVRDVTRAKLAAQEEQRYRDRAEQAQRLESLGVLAGGIAHDFNNLLVGVLGNADLALKQIGRTHPGARNLEAIGTAAQRASDLCQQLLAYSGKGRFLVEVINLSELVRDMANLLEVSVSQRATLKLQLDPKVPAVEVDVVQMRQVVMNLITNASEAVDLGGQITVRVATHDCDEAYLASSLFEDELQPGPYVLLEVTDDGCGMSPQSQARIFDPFYTTKFTGRGLGLAAVLGIVKGHGGAIRVYSEVGRGTSFKVALPVSGERVSSTESASASDPAGLSGHVLLIDDQADVLMVAEEMLHALGLEVSTAGGGLEGIASYTKRRADLVLLDMTMPEIDGYETFRRLRALDPEVKVVLSSGYNEQEATDQFVGRKLAGFIQKPYRLSTLERVIRDVLSSSD